MFIVMVGPIDYWWSENWETPQHLAYMDWRNDINKKLVEAGHLVYRPWEAFKGAWNEVAQVVNDAAIDRCDAMVNLCPSGVPAYGTATEVERFKHAPGQHWGNYFEAPPGDYSQIEDLIVPLDDPYSDVNRKSYTKACGCK